MTAYTELRDALVDVLEAVPNIGKVHGRERFTTEPSKFLDFFKHLTGSSSQIRAWFVLRESTQPIENTAFGEVRHRHVFVLRGYLGFKDSADTYGEFQELCDTVMAIIDNQTTLSTSGVVVRMVGYSTLRSFETGQFSNVLAHVAEIEVPIETMAVLGTP